MLYATTAGALQLDKIGPLGGMALIGSARQTAVGVEVMPELTAFDRLAEDARMAPTLSGRAALARMAAAEIAHHGRLTDRLTELGLGLLHLSVLGFRAARNQRGLEAAKPFLVRAGPSCAR